MKRARDYASGLTGIEGEREETIMKLRLAGLIAIIGCAALCLALPAHGQNSITLTGVNGSTSGGDLCSAASGCEDVYTGVYYSTVDNTANTPTICDDFNHNVTIGETWNASAVNTSSLNSTNILQLEFGSGANGQIASVVYAEVATLVSGIFNGTATFGTGAGAITGVTQTDLSEAIWDITTPGGISGISKNAGLLVTYVEGLFGSDTSKAALAYLNGLNLWILTPSPNNGPQEFWAPGGPSYNIPEGGSALLYLLLAGVSCFGAMFFRSQKRLRNPVTA
jgi:hypothetical protein